MDPGRVAQREGSTAVSFPACAGQGGIAKGEDMASYTDPTKKSFAAFRDMAREGPVHMLNLIRLREQADYGDGTIATGAEAYAAYGRESAPIFRDLGGRIVWAGQPELVLIGPDDEGWDIAFIAEYPSVDAFVGMLRAPDYRRAVRHRQAAVADTRLIRMRPGTPGNAFGEMVVNDG
jgi:uncharacterized protein (DUF1330 family)